MARRRRPHVMLYLHHAFVRSFVRITRGYQKSFVPVFAVKQRCPVLKRHTKKFKRTQLSLRASIPPHVPTRARTRGHRGPRQIFPLSFQTTTTTSVSQSVSQSWWRSALARSRSR